MQHKKIAVMAANVDCRAPAALAMTINIFGARNRRLIFLVLAMTNKC